MTPLFTGLLAFYAVFAAAGELLTVPTWVPVTEAWPELTNGYRVESFGGGVYMVTDNWYNSLFVVSTKGVIVVDAPPTMAHYILYAIGNTTNQPITHFIYSHSHSDHAGGAYLFQNVTRIAHAATKDLLSAVPSPNQPLPDVTFKNKHTIHLGNQTLELSYKGPNHDPGNIFIYAPKQKVLMLVDVIFPGWTPFAHLAVAQNIPGFIEAHDQVLEYDFDHFVGGHLTRSGNRTDVLVQRDYINDLKTNCADAMTLSTQPSSPTNPISAQALLNAALTANPNNPWAGFKVYLTDVSSYCNNVTNEKWLGHLSGVDVWGPENAYAMVESLRLDFDFLGPFGVHD